MRTKHAASPAEAPASSAFLTDIDTLRRRARENMEQGAVTPSYRGPQLDAARNGRDAGAAGLSLRGSS